MVKMKRKPCGHKRKCDCKQVTCANCGKEYWESSFSEMSRYMARTPLKPACCYDCNKALKQII